MIRKGWVKCEILRAFELNFQIEALEANAKISLFSHQNSVAKKLVILPTKSYKFDVKSFYSLAQVLNSCLLN